MDRKNNDVIIPVNGSKVVSTIISHELKNPLNAIIGFSDLIIEENSIKVACWVGLYYPLNIIRLFLIILCLDF